MDDVPAIVTPDDRPLSGFSTATAGPAFPLNDTRLTAARDCHTPFVPPSPASSAEWARHCSVVRDRIRFAANLLPEPTRTRLNVNVFDRSDYPGFSVEKVSFESRPGVSVAGNLYRPEFGQRPFPAVLCPHGHWPMGRLERSAEADVVARCVLLARAGFVVLTYDMVGYGDDRTSGHPWNVVAAMTALRFGVSLFGVQLWNSIRALDVLSEVADVDSNRIGCTGGSGGATQTYYLAAIDDRIRAMAPVCMLSAHYQGGCPCEEPLLFHSAGLSTVDVVGASAPRHVLLVSVTGDWTNENEAMEVPALRRIYALHGAEHRVVSVHSEGEHNYGRAIRQVVVRWLSGALAGISVPEEALDETTIPDIPETVLRVRAADRMRASQRREDDLIGRLIAEERQHFRAVPTTGAEVSRIRTVWGPVYRTAAQLNQPERLCPGTPWGVARTDTIEVRSCAIGRYGHVERTPGVWILRRGAPSPVRYALVVAGDGKQSLFTDGHPIPTIARLLDHGYGLLAIDLLGTGEASELLDQDPHDRGDPVYYAFNKSVGAHRIQDVVNGIAVLRQRLPSSKPLLVGLGAGAVFALLARPLVAPVAGTVVDLSNEETDGDEYWTGVNYLPCLGRLGDLRGALILAGSEPILLCGATPTTEQWARAAYKSARLSHRLTIVNDALAPHHLDAWLSS